MRDPPSKFPSLASARLPAARSVRQSIPTRASSHVPLSSAAPHVRSLRRVEACGVASCNRRWRGKKKFGESREVFFVFSPLLIDWLLRSRIERKWMFFFRHVDVVRKNHRKIRRDSLVPFVREFRLRGEFFNVFLRGGGEGKTHQNFLLRQLFRLRDLFLSLRLHLCLHHNASLAELFHHLQIHVRRVDEVAQVISVFEG